MHNHTGFSPFDGLGYPDDHFKWCIENGLNAHAITEHGNMNSYAHAQLWVEDWCKSHKDSPFVYIPGVEAYFHPDLEQWKRDKIVADQAASDRKKSAKRLREEQEGLLTKIVPIVDANDDAEDMETSNALVIENEDETRSNKHFNPVNRRHHLVLLPKNQEGLRKIFEAVSWSYLHGFYRFPRIDTGVLRTLGRDRDVIASSACLGGPIAFNVFRELQQVRFDALDQAMLDDPALMDRCVLAVGDCYDRMVDCLGQENFLLELQFNRLPAQNLVNRAIIEFARRSNLTRSLIVTCDAHYYGPDRWKDRELYKRLGYLNYAEYTPDSIPKSREELKCELYPKNAQQMWGEYLRSKEGTLFYDDVEVLEAIERTHDIAHNVIGAVPPDRSPKFPNGRLVPEGTSSFRHLVDLCKKGIEERGLANDPVYVERLKEELGVIKAMKNADYFVSMQKIMELARKRVLCGPARGCFVPETRVLMSDGMHAPIGTIKPGDTVKDAAGTDQRVLEVFRYDVDEELLELEFDEGRKVRCTKDHRFLTKNRGWVEAVHLAEDDDLVDVIQDL